MAFPLVVRAVRLGIEHVDRQVEESAGDTRRESALGVPHHHAAAGASRRRWRALIIGFAKALGEFGATITFVSNIPGETQTLALAIFTQLERPGRRRRRHAPGAGLDRDLGAGARRV